VIVTFGNVVMVWFLILAMIPLLRMMLLFRVLLALCVVARLTVFRMIAHRALSIDGVLPVLTAVVPVINAVRADGLTHGLTAILCGGTLRVASAVTFWDDLCRRWRRRRLWHRWRRRWHRAVICLHHYLSVRKLATSPQLPVLES